MGPKIPYLIIFQLKFKKRHCHIWYYSQIFLKAKFRAKIKIKQLINFIVCYSIKKNHENKTSFRSIFSYRQLSISFKSLGRKVFKVSWQLMIGEDTSETSLVLMNLFYWIKYDEIYGNCFMFKATYMLNCAKKFESAVKFL